MEIDQLRNFLKVAETRNFTRAAEEIGLSQPALSRSISRLEEDLGQPVFERQSRGVVLTEAGRILKPRAEQVLVLMDDTKAEISDDGESGRIRIAAIPTIAPYFLPEILRRFAASFPQASLIVQEDTTDELTKRCTHGEIDLAVVALPITEKYLEVESLFEEELLIVLPTEHALAKKKQLRLTDIESLPFVLLGEAHCLSDNIQTFCRQRSFQPVSVERTSQLAMVQELVSLNHGVSMIPQMAAKTDDSQRRLYRSVSGERPMRTIALMWNPYRFQSRLLERFKEAVRETARDFAD